MKYTKLILNFFVFVMLFVFASQVFADQIVTDYTLVPQHERSVKRVTAYDPRVNNFGWETIVYLEPPTNKPIIGRGYNNERQARGTARVSSNQQYAQNAPQGGATVKVRNIKPTYNLDEMYEGWLVDEDSGYWLSFGVFSTDNFGNGRLNTAGSPVGTMPEKQKLFHALDLYDAVAVTLEPYPDNDPRPSKEVALYGKIDKQTFVVPEPTTQQKLWGSTIYYPSASYANTAANLPKNMTIRPERKYVYDDKLKQWIEKNK